MALVWLGIQRLRQNVLIRSSSMPCWAEMRPGVFERQADVPGYPQAL